MASEPVESVSFRRGGSRLMMAVGVAAIAALSSATTVFASHTFPDVPESSQFHDDIQWMADNGIAEGFADGGYHPGAPVSRQAMAAFMHRLSGQGAVDPTVDAAELEGQTLDQVEPMWAVVNSDGSLLRSSGDVVSASPVGTGDYEVIFDRDVTECAYVATSAQEATEIQATNRAGNASGAFVSTRSSAGAPANRGYQIVVFC